MSKQILKNPQSGSHLQLTVHVLLWIFIPVLYSCHCTLYMCTVVTVHSIGVQSSLYTVQVYSIQADVRIGFVTSHLKTITDG